MPRKKPFWKTTWWRNYSILVTYPLIVLGVVTSSLYSEGRIQGFTFWYLVVFIPLAAWQWIETLLRWRRERKDPGHDGAGDDAA